MWRSRDLSPAPSLAERWGMWLVIGGARHGSISGAACSESTITLKEAPCAGD